MISFTALAVGLLIVIGLCLVVGIFFAWWAAREEAKDQAQRRSLQRIIQASDDPREWPRVKGPHGFKGRSR
jgi:cbb3-type cytochrome oxidase subunit 3